MFVCVTWTPTPQLPHVIVTEVGARCVRTGLVRRTLTPQSLHWRHSPRCRRRLSAGRLYNEFEWMNVTLSNATIARTWLLQMGNAAARNGVAIQYCMPFPRHALQRYASCSSLPARGEPRRDDILCCAALRSQPCSRSERPTTTYLAAWTSNGKSGRPPSSQTHWRCLPSRTTSGAWCCVWESVAAAALMMCFRQTYRTTTNQPGNPYNGAKELYPALESAVATLSTGPVTPSDGIGLTNVSLVMRSCASDGMLLQPSEPATSIDSTFLFASFGSNGPNVSVLLFTHQATRESRSSHFLVSLCVCLCLCLWSGPIVEYVLSDWLLPVVPCLRC